MQNTQKCGKVTAMSCEDLPKLELVAGEVSDHEISFADDDGNVIDITGVTIHFTAKRSTTDADGDAIINLAVSSHVDAANGESNLPIDLSSLPDSIVRNGAELIGDVWLVDGSGNKDPQGFLTVQIDPAVTGSF